LLAAALLPPLLLLALLPLRLLALLLLLLLWRRLRLRLLLPLLYTKLLALGGLATSCAASSRAALGASCCVRAGALALTPCQVQARRHFCDHPSALDRHMRGHMALHGHGQIAIPNGKIATHGRWDTQDSRARLALVA
jgi:hypothetical protein